MALTYYEINDLVTGVLFNDQKKRASNIDPLLLRSYPAARQLLKKAQVREHGGKDIRFDVNVQGSNSATHPGAYATISRTVNDFLKQGTIQMRNTNTYFCFDILEEEFNQGEWQIINHIDNREQQAMIDATKLLESDFWSFADLTNETSPQGILYYLPYCASAGFVGTVSGSHTEVAGLNPSTYTGWKSYGDVYVAVTDADLILKVRTAMSKTDFMAPIDTMIVSDYDTGSQWQLFANLSTILQLEDLAKSQNENVGPDLDAFNGRVRIRRTPVIEVPTLDSNTRSPVFGINWGVTKNFIKSGWWMKRIMNKPNSNQPLVVSVDLWCVHQLVMFNRRTGGFNIATA